MDLESRTSLQSMRLTGGSHVMSTNYIQQLSKDMTKTAQAFAKPAYRKTTNDYTNKITKYSGGTG